MEEEYRMQKAQGDAQPQSAVPTKVIHEDGTVSPPKHGASLQGKAADDDASTRGMVSPTQSAPDEDVEGEKDADDATAEGPEDRAPTPMSP